MHYLKGKYLPIRSVKLYELPRVNFKSNIMSDNLMQRVKYISLQNTIDILLQNEKCLQLFLECVLHIKHESESNLENKNKKKITFTLTHYYYFFCKMFCFINTEKTDFFFFK